jgi:hypothetical protein
MPDYNGCAYRQDGNTWKFDPPYDDDPVIEEDE